MKLIFPEPYRHTHPPVHNLNELFEQKTGFGQNLSDRIAKIVGSWPFIIIQSIILVIWVVLNIAAWTQHWDPYPFILLNLFLSLEAAYTAPVIMMSQNRLAERDRIEAHEDFQTNLKAEEEIRIIMNHLVAQDQALLQIHDLLTQLTQEKRMET